MTGAERLMRVMVALILLVMIAPIAVVVLLSFSSANYLMFPPPAFGLRWYQGYLASRDWLAATWLSVEVAVLVVALSTVLGTLAAMGLARLPWVARMLATGLILSPLIMPVIIVAIGLYYAFA
jgi:putative spermidine/putrescine transport system permease protein